jgi:hypothetical protein
MYGYRKPDSRIRIFGIRRVFWGQSTNSSNESYVSFQYICVHIARGREGSTAWPLPFEDICGLSFKIPTSKLLNNMLKVSLRVTTNHVLGSSPRPKSAT